MASLGFEDLYELRKQRPEINDAVLPYIREAMLPKNKVHADNWFYVEVCPHCNCAHIGTVPTLQLLIVRWPVCDLCAKGAEGE